MAAGNLYLVIEMFNKYFINTNNTDYIKQRNKFKIILMSRRANYT